MPWPGDSQKLKKVAGFMVDTGWDDLPQRVRHQAKRALLDSLGSAIAGSATPAGQLMADFARRNYGGRGASILVGGHEVSPVGAALAMGFAANALDIDDGYRLIKGHPGACVLPAVLTAIQMAAPINGPELLTALVIGYELCIRAGLIRHALYDTYHASGSWGAVGGAAAAGRLLGLDADTIMQAMGAAEYHAPIAPMMKGIATPAMVKDSIGWGAMVAVASALMAKDGFTGIVPLFADSPKEEWIDELGRDFRMLDLYFKPYAACRWGQPAVAAALKVVAEHEIRPGRIKSIKVRTFEAAKALVNDPPQNTEQAQYSLAFPVAAAILDGEVGPRQVLPPRIFDRDLLDLMARVSVETTPEFDGEFPARTLAEVAVETTGGRILASGPTEAKWEPATGLPSDDELRAKFLWLVGPVLGHGHAARLADLVMGLDEQPGLDGLWGLCRAG